jgi:hypothetical protein
MVDSFRRIDQSWQGVSVCNVALKLLSEVFRGKLGCLRIWLLR